MDKGEIVLAGGCFWGTEAYLKRLPGIIQTEAGLRIQAPLSLPTKRFVRVKQEQRKRSVSSTTKMLFLCHFFWKPTCVLSIPHC